MITCEGSTVPPVLPGGSLSLSRLPSRQAQENSTSYLKHTVCIFSPAEEDNNVVDSPKEKIPVRRILYGVNSTIPH